MARSYMGAFGGLFMSLAVARGLVRFVLGMLFVLSVLSVLAVLAMMKVGDEM
jgi:hypothetical protein